MAVSKANLKRKVGRPAKKGVKKVVKKQAKRGRGRPKKIVSRKVVKAIKPKKVIKRKIAKRKVVKKRVVKKRVVKKRVVKKRVVKKTKKVMKGGAKEGLHFYIDKDIPYTNMYKEYKKNPNKVFAMLTTNIPEISIIYNGMTANMSEIGKNKMIVYTYTGPLSTGDIVKASRKVILKDIFDANNSRINGKTVCNIISDNTGITLENLSYNVGAKNNAGQVYQSCTDIHSKIYLTKKILGAKQNETMMLLEPQEYEDFCSSRSKEDKDECEVVSPWMTGLKGKVAPQSICKFIKPGFIAEGKCTVDTKQRDKIIKGLRKRINKCIADMGCVTGTIGEGAKQKKGMRRHIKSNAVRKNPKSPFSQICCKRSFKAVAKAGLRMQRLYKILGNLPLAEQMALVSRSAMSSKEKRDFMGNLAMADKESQNLVKNLSLDGPTQKLLSAFATILRASLHKEFMELTNLKMMGDIDESDAAKKLEELTDSKENAGRMMTLLKSTAKSIVNALAAVGKTLFKAIKYFTSKGFDLLKWIFNHPSTVMWLTYTGVYLKKKSCEFISIKIYGDPEIVEVGLLARSADFKKYTKEQSQKIAGFVKRQFLSYAYTFVDSSSFSAVVLNVSTVIETGLLYVIAMIPVYGPILSISISTSGGLSVVLSSLGFVVREAMYYGFTAMMVKEAGQDFYEIISGTCIKRPDEQHKLTLAAIKKESAAIYDSVAEGAKTKTKDLSNSFNNMIKSGFSSIFGS